MIDPDPPARVPQLSEAEWSDEARAIFGIISGVMTQAPSPQTQNHVLRTFAHYPALAKPFLTFNSHLLGRTTLPPRLRQIAIHRVAWVRGCAYMWSSHLRVSLPLGLTRADFDAVKQGAASPHWTEFERILVHAVDKLVDGSEMDDATWAALSAELDTKQIMDLLFTVGCYTTLTMVFNTLKIEREPELLALAAEYGAPQQK